MRTAAHRAALAALLTGLVALAACGGGESATPDSGDGQSVTIVGKEFAFEPDSLAVSAGTASLTIDNQGVIEHDLVVEELDIDVYAEPGTQTTEQVTFEAGTYTFYCSVPGHRESGMEGTLTVD